MPRGSLPSTSMQCANRPPSNSSLNRARAGRFSASTTQSMSGARSSITLAVIRVEVSSTGSTVSSTQPSQSPRPFATIRGGALAGAARKSPRFSRNSAHAVSNWLGLRRSPSGVSMSTRRVVSAAIISALSWSE